MLFFAPVLSPLFLGADTDQGKFEDQLWPDDWTSVTRDGKRSAQFEHTMMITENGVEVLTRSPRQVDGPSETKPEQGEEKEVVSH